MFNQAKQPFSLEVFRPASIYRKSARLSQAEEEAARSSQGRYGYMKGLSSMIRNKSPQLMMCLDPSVMFKDLDR
ncbi:hypothetical protein AOLI_G00222540 [Acnodon oligacanthus]